MLRVCLASQEGQALCRLSGITTGGQFAGWDQARSCERPPATHLKAASCAAVPVACCAIMPAISAAMQQGLLLSRQLCAR